MHFARQAMALSAFLCACGLIVSEGLLFLREIMSPRGFAFATAVLLCWLFLDNLITAQDLQRATAGTSTDGERALLRRVAYGALQNRALRVRLDNEIEQHLETAMELDQLTEALFRKTRGCAFKRSLSA
jgi:hypothetical protein